MRFEPVIQETRRRLSDTRDRTNLDRLRDELVDVTKIMTSSIHEVMGRGERLDQTLLVSRDLSEESKLYLGGTKRLNLELLWRTYGPIVLIISCVVFLLLLYYYVF